MPPANKAFTNSYHEFFMKERQQLPTSMRNAERERLLGQRCKMLSEAEREKWKALAIEVGGGNCAPTLTLRLP